MHWTYQHEAILCKRCLGKSSRRVDSSAQSIATSCLCFRESARGEGQATRARPVCVAPSLPGHAGLSHRKGGVNHTNQRGMATSSLTTSSELAAALRANIRQQKELRREEEELRRRLAEAEAAEMACALEEDQDDEVQETAAIAAGTADWSSATEFPWSAAVSDCLRNKFGFTGFRPLQLEVINATLSGRDCFAILPTGAGKSLLFQLPGLLDVSSPSGNGAGSSSRSSSSSSSSSSRNSLQHGKRGGGLTVVVSPLVSLMTDQVANLTSRGVRAALLATDVTSREEQTVIHNEIADPASSGLRFVYVTPERVAKSKLLLSRLQKAFLAGQLVRIAIDEAHCAAAQGHDFRPDYLSLGTLRASFPSVPILALTATASEAVRADVERTLGLSGSGPAGVVRFRGHFDRANIRYAVCPKPATDDALLDEMASICLNTFDASTASASAAGAASGGAAACRRLGAGIVYTLSRADAERVQQGLWQRQVACACYHAGCEARQRQQVQQAWQAGAVQVVVATVAFGLGIDKPDVRFVLHHTVSKSLYVLARRPGHGAILCILGSCPALNLRIPSNPFESLRIPRIMLLPARPTTRRVAALAAMGCQQRPWCGGNRPITTVSPASPSIPPTAPPPCALCTPQASFASARHAAGAPTCPIYLASRCGHEVRPSCLTIDAATSAHAPLKHPRRALTPSRSARTWAASAWTRCACLHR